MTFILIKTIHLFAAFIYGGFLITDNLFLSKIQKTYGKDEEFKEIRESFMKYVRKVVPPSLIVAVLSGLYLISQVFGPVVGGLTWFQTLLGLKAFLGIWLGVRGFMQVYMGIQPLLFKSHVLPFTFVITIIFLSQFMYL
jgi:hypothetical protein